MSEFIFVGNLKDFPLGWTKAVDVQNKSICIAVENGRAFAFDNQCTHAAAPLSDCEIEEGQVTCPLHGARFSIETGAATLPAVEPVKTYEVKVEDGKIFLRI